SRYSASAGLVTLGGNIRLTWASRARRLRAAPTKPKWRRNSAPLILSTTPPPTPAPPRRNSVARRGIWSPPPGAKTAPQPSEGLSIVLGVGPEPIETSSTDLVFGNRKLRGALTGDPATGDATLRFSVLSGASAMIETVPLGQAAAAYAKMMSGKARSRMVLTMEG